MKNKRFLSFITAFSVIISMLPIYTGYAYSSIENSSVASIQNRQAIIQSTVIPFLIGM